MPGAGTGRSAIIFTAPVQAPGFAEDGGSVDDLGIGGFAAAAVDELVATARSDTAEADDARAALALLLRLTDGSAA